MKEKVRETMESKGRKDREGAGKRGNGRAVIKRREEIREGSAREGKGREQMEGTGREGMEAKASNGTRKKK